MNILQLTPGIGLGGLEWVVLNLCRGLALQGRHRPVVMTVDHPVGGPSLREHFEAAGVEVIDDFRKAPGFSFNLVPRLAREIRSRRVDVVHTHDLQALIYAAFAKVLPGGRFRIVHTQHTFIHVINNPRYGRYERFFTRFADAICAVSDDLRQKYATVGVDPGRVHVVRNGMAFPEAPLIRVDERTALRERLLSGLADPAAARALRERIDRPWLLCMARIDPNKGQQHVLDVWNAMPDGSPAALVYVGQETREGSLAELLGKAAAARAREDVVYAGFTRAPADWLLASDVFVSGSQFEGMPLAPLEAFGSGVETFLSDIPGHAVVPEGSHRFRLDAKDLGARELRALVERLATDFEGMRRRAWERGRSVRESMGIQAMTERYVRHYEGTR